MEGHPWIFTWELLQHLIPHQWDGLNFSKVMRQMDMKQQGPSIYLSLWEMKGTVTKSCCSFQVTSINRQHTGGKRRIPELNNLKSGLECVSPNLSFFFFFTSVPILVSCATTQQGLGGRAMEQERTCWPESELQFKGTVPPSHVHTGFDSPHL